MTRGSPSVNMQVMIMWATLASPALSLLLSQAPPGHCYSDEEWTAYGETCQSLETKNICTDGKAGAHIEPEYFGAFANDACCVCGGGVISSSWCDVSCSGAVCSCKHGVTPPAAGNSASSPAACQGDASTWDAGWGGCSTYVHALAFCDEDSSGGLLAEQVCSECGQCAPTSPAAGNAASSPAANTAVSATGDPHMQNMLGQRYDLTQPGRHTLLQIPRVASDSDDLLLSVTADAEHEGGACADMYFKALNITGEWASAHQKDGYMYAADAPQMVASWRTFGKVEMKVVWGRSLEDVEYLNLFVRHLKRVGHDIGGLLGMDDYRQAAKVNALCDSTTLLTSINDETRAPRKASVAMADQ